MMLIEAFTISYWPLVAYGLAAFVIALGTITLLDELA